MINMINALLKKLSLNAPVNCVKNNGKNRRVRKREIMVFVGSHQTSYVTIYDELLPLISQLVNIISIQIF